jgi:26S proteasome regulatory subunit N6
MRAIARAHQKRNLADFEKALRDYQKGYMQLRISLISRSDSNFPHTELSSDPTIRSHLAALYDTLLEQNLLRIVEPYSVVEIEYVAQTVGQVRQAVEAKCEHISSVIKRGSSLILFLYSRLSQMILDKVFHGVLDQGRGCLLVFDPAEADVINS